MLTVAKLIWCKEEQLAQEDDAYKTIDAFEIGADSIGVRDGESGTILPELKALNPVTYFGHTKGIDYQYHHNQLTFKSNIETGITENNTVACKIYRARTLDSAIVLIPHWNASVAQYDRLAQYLCYLGHSVAVLTPPYHDKRRPESWAYAQRMVSSNLGMTIQSIRQSVLDTRCVLDWFESEGCARLGLIGVSIGSCIASLVAAHDRRVKRVALLLMAANFAEVVWTGRATRHIRSAFEGNISLEKLKQYWAIISPDTYVPQLKEHDVRVLIISGKHDAVFLPYLTKEIIEHYRNSEVTHVWNQYICGHYTLASFPFNVAALIASHRWLKAS